MKFSIFPILRARPTVTSVSPSLAAKSSKRFRASEPHAASASVSTRYWGAPRPAAQTAESASKEAEPITPIYERSPMEIGGRFMGGVHLVFWMTPLGVWKLAKAHYSLADAKTYARQFSAQHDCRTRLVGYWAEKVEELNKGSYVNSWEAKEADWT